MRFPPYSLALAVLPLLLAAIIFSNGPSPPEHEQTAAPEHQMLGSHGWMENAEYGHVYRLSGAKMRAATGSGALHIDEARLEVDQEEGHAWLVQADAALLNEAEQTILLRGNVAISRGINHCLRTDNVLLHLQENRAIVSSRLRESYMLGGLDGAGRDSGSSSCGSPADHDARGGRPH